MRTLTKNEELYLLNVAAAFLERGVKKKSHLDLIEEMARGRNIRNTYQCVSRNHWGNVRLKALHFGMLQARRFAA